MKFLAFTYPWLESVLKRELKNRKINLNESGDWFACFEWDVSTMVKTNLWLRTASKVYIILWSLDDLQNFEQLFDLVFSIDRKSYISSDFKISVEARSNRSKLFSEPTIQSIAHKAILKKLLWDRKHIPTKSEVNEIRIEIFKDSVKILLNSSWESLYRRWYKKENSQASLKETLASWIIWLSKLDNNLYDPFCWSGTILIENALMKLNIAPWINRSFAFENFVFFDHNILEKERWRARSRKKSVKFKLMWTDIDSRILKIAQANAISAWVWDYIDFQRMDFMKLSNKQCSDILTNPPYNKRIKLENINEIYTKLENIFLENNIRGWVITWYDDFRFDQSRSFRTLSNGWDLVRFAYRS